jgi:hypothetical protein
MDNCKLEIENGFGWAFSFFIRLLSQIMGITCNFGEFSAGHEKFRANLPILQLGISLFVAEFDFCTGQIMELVRRILFLEILCIIFFLCFHEKWVLIFNG